MILPGSYLLSVIYDLAWLEILARVILQSDPARICKPCLHDLSCTAEFSLLRKEPAKKCLQLVFKNPHWDSRTCISLRV